MIDRKRKEKILWQVKVSRHAVYDHEVAKFWNRKRYMKEEKREKRRRERRKAKLKLKTEIE